MALQTLTTTGTTATAPPTSTPTDGGNSGNGDGGADLNTKNSVPFTVTTFSNTVYPINTLVNAMPPLHPAGETTSQSLTRCMR